MNAFSGIAAICGISECTHRVKLTESCPYCERSATAMGARILAFDSSRFSRVDREPGTEPAFESAVNQDDWNATEWLGVPFDTDDWANLSACVALIREFAASRSKYPAVAADFNRMADRLAVSRKKVQARIAAGVP